ncbi:MAG: magnesium transporter [Chromatiaceae bacterium]|nr:magnesium transporter [Chromatiaceae bacterium]MCF7993355.1 magnesium transporter [Chromatiaceae bacterium]MCF8002814.1 magnesium transporter [Chromatiaceae bacterium]MCF8015947.1 magnesium transporter [Chromatiaceae bacterium]
MPMPDLPRPDEDMLQRHLREVRQLLAKQQLVEEVTRRQRMPHQRLVENITHRQNLARLQRKLDRLHPADIAYILETLPLDERLYVWGLVKADKDGDILLEVSDAVRPSLLETMDRDELKTAAEALDADELADLIPDLPTDVAQEVLTALDQREQAQVREAMSYAEGTVGALMDFDLVKVREDVTLEVVARYLRRFDALPDHTDKLFVVDRDERLRGILTLEALLINEPETPVSDVMQASELILFRAEDEARQAAHAFERYDLVSVPVVDKQRRLVARLTVSDVVDYIQEENEAEILSQAGLEEEEDIFAPILRSVKNRWAWLAINLVTAVIASRVINLFEDSIAQLVALAALMPIVAGIGGNAGNQTITMIVRAIAMGQVQPSAWRRLMVKELGVALINGLVWGGVIGVFAGVVYQNLPLGVVMVAAMALNLLLAATAGVLIPLLRQRLGRDPALGSSVMITALTDSGGFFIFLGLATLFLL